MQIPPLHPQSSLRMYLQSRPKAGQQPHQNPQAWGTHLSLTTQILQIVNAYYFRLLNLGYYIMQQQIANNTSMYLSSSKFSIGHEFRCEDTKGVTVVFQVFSQPRVKEVNVYKYVKSPCKWPFLAYNYASEFVFCMCERERWDGRERERERIKKYHEKKIIGSRVFPVINKHLMFLFQLYAHCWKKEEQWLLRNKAVWYIVDPAGKKSLLVVTTLMRKWIQTIRRLSYEFHLTSAGAIESPWKKANIHLEVLLCFPSLLHPELQTDRGLQPSDSEQWVPERKVCPTHFWIWA